VRKSSSLCDRRTRHVVLGTPYAPYMQEHFVLLRSSVGSGHDCDSISGRWGSRRLGTATLCMARVCGTLAGLATLRAVFSKLNPGGYGASSPESLANMLVDKPALVEGSNYVVILCRIVLASSSSYSSHPATAGESREMFCVAREFCFAYRALGGYEWSLGGSSRQESHDVCQVDNPYVCTVIDWRTVTKVTLPGVRNATCQARSLSHSQGKGKGRAREPAFSFLGSCAMREMELRHRS
jgi:hypothetical protein